MGTLLWIIGATFIVSLLAWIGIISLAIKAKLLNKILLKLADNASISPLGKSLIFKGKDMSIVNDAPSQE